jgi:hypothetical protein
MPPRPHHLLLGRQARQRSASRANCRHVQCAVSARHHGASAERLARCLVASGAACPGRSPRAASTQCAPLLASPVSIPQAETHLCEVSLLDFHTLLENPAAGRLGVEPEQHHKVLVVHVSAAGAGAPRDEPINLSLQLLALVLVRQLFYLQSGARLLASCDTAAASHPQGVALKQTQPWLPSSRGKSMRVTARRLSP